LCNVGKLTKRGASARAIVLYVALLTLEVPCAMPMCPAVHYEMPVCGELSWWHDLVQFNYCRLVSVIEANIHVLQHSDNSEGWEMGDIQYELSL